MLELLVASRVSENFVECSSEVSSTYLIRTEASKGSVDSLSRSGAWGSTCLEELVDSNRVEPIVLQEEVDHITFTRSTLQGDGEPAYRVDYGRAGLLE